MEETRDNKSPDGEPCPTCGPVNDNRYDLANQAAPSRISLPIEPPTLARAQLAESLFPFL